MNRNINSWNTLPIGVFQQICSLNEQKADDLDFRVCALIHGLTYEQLLDMPWTQVSDLMDDCAFLYEKPKPRKMQKTYEINGRRYNTIVNFKDMTTAQYIDFKQLADGCENHMGLFLAVFLIPEGKRYNDGYSVEFVENEITQHFNVEDAMSLTAFFFGLCVKSTRRTLLYSESLLTVVKMRLKKGEMKDKVTELESQIRELRSLLQSLSTSELWRL